MGEENDWLFTVSERLTVDAAAARKVAIPARGSLPRPEGACGGWRKAFSAADDIPGARVKLWSGGLRLTANVNGSKCLFADCAIDSEYKNTH